MFKEGERLHQLAESAWAQCHFLGEEMQICGTEGARTWRCYQWGDPIDRWILRKIAQADTNNLISFEPSTSFKEPDADSGWITCFNFVVLQCVFWKTPGNSLAAKASHHSW